jgi:Protein of unknown function (DUF3592)
VRVFWHFFVAHEIEVYLGLTAAAVIGVVVLLKKRFAARANTWPTVTARIENVFVDELNKGPNRIPITHAVLAYAYSVGNSMYSGEIRLRASEAVVDVLDKELVGQALSIQYDPAKPEVSIFLKHKLRGWLVVKDSRLSLSAWIDNLS